MEAREVGSSLAELAEGEVHVWVARPTALTYEELALCAKVLSPDERARVPRFRFERHQREATVSRALVRTTLARYVDRAPEAFAYRVGSHGRPDLAIEPPSGLFFNSTNHPELVACAVARHAEIGVDTEPLSRGEEILEVARTVFSAPELDAMEALPVAARPDRAVSLWTCKEAYIKARGLGFSASLLEIVVEFPASAPPRLRFLAGYDEPGAWSLRIEDVPGFRIAVAVRARARDVKLVVRETGFRA
jgi:4'-phosphopantetheinyl transferase